MKRAVFFVVLLAAFVTVGCSPVLTPTEEAAPATQSRDARQSRLTGQAQQPAAGEIVAGVAFERGGRYLSPSGAYFLNFNPDGNIVVARTADSGYVWGLNSVPGVDFPRAVRAQMNPDGRFVVTDANGAEVWSIPQTNAQPGSKLTLDDTGALLLVTPGNAVVWTSADTNKILGDRALPIRAGTSIERQYRYMSPDGNHYLLLQNDGNLVVNRTSDNGNLWGLHRIPNVPIRSGATAEVTPEGQFTVKAADGSVIWTEPASGSDSTAVLDITPEGVLSLSIANTSAFQNGTLWSSDGAAPVAVTQPAPAPPAPAPANIPGILKAGEEMVVGQKYSSPDGRFYVLFPSDGNLQVGTRNPDEYTGGLFNFDKTGAWKNAKQAMIAADGNLILKDAAGTQIWSTNVANPEPGMVLTFSDTGELQLRRPSGGVAWSLSDWERSGKNTSPSERAASVLPNGAPPMTTEQTEILDRHNQLRALHGAPALQWSPVLAAEAQQWADNNCSTMQHAPGEISLAGENLSAFQLSDAMVDRVQSWYDEVKVYNYANPGFNKGGSSQQTQTGHFTQVVWKATELLGCAKALCPNGPYPGWLVCRYWPAGNYPDNVGGEAASYTRNVLPLK